MIPRADFGFAADESLRARFGHVTTWVFDLDNTLYPPGSGIWPKINERISLFLIELFGIDGLSARALHQHYYSRHGTTLSGLIKDDVEVGELYLKFVHDIDRSTLAPDPVLAREVAKLPGRKLIFTNGSRDHAILTARQLGLDGLFEDAFDIVAAGLTSKPAEAAYEAFFAKYDINPQCAAIFDDLARNLVVPSARGMTTILVVPDSEGRDERGPSDGPAPNAAPADADFVTDDLAGFLGRVNGALIPSTLGAG